MIVCVIVDEQLLSEHGLSMLMTRWLESEKAS